LVQQSLATLENSSIICRNNSDRGTSFIVTLPYNGMQPEA
jgi:signal transduction histidine kinase